MKKLKDFFRDLVPKNRLYNVKIAYWTKGQEIKYEYMSQISKKKGNRLRNELMEMFVDEWYLTKGNEDMKNLQSFQSIDINEVKVTM